MVRLIDVTKIYENGSEALRNVSFRIDDGEFVFLVGPSGSGKSTVTRLLTAEIAPTDGRVIVNGHNLNTIKPSKVPYLRRTLGVVFQDFRLIEKKTVWENLAFAMRVVGSSPRSIRKRIPYVLELVGLENKAKEFPTQLSGGEQQMLAMGRALMSDPKLMMLDEPSMGLAPILVDQIFDIIKDLHKAGTTILLVEQNAQMALSVADRGYVLETGKIVKSAPAKELLNDAAVKAAYLGG